MSTASYAAITALISKLGVVMYKDVEEQHNMLRFLNSHLIIENHNELHCNVTHVIFLNVGQM